MENYACGINLPSTCNSGFIYYDFGYYGKKPDTGAIQALGKVAAKKTTPDGPVKPIGYGVENNWMNINAAQLANELYANNLTITHVELLGYGKETGYENPSALYPKFLTFVEEMRKKDITVFVNIINWNKGVSRYYPENGDVSICESQYSDSWFSGILDFMVNQVGTEGIILQTASEWGNGQGAGCEEKAIKMNKLMEQRWTGMKSWNYGTQPTSAPAGYTVFEYHPGDLNTIPSGALITTDHGGSLEPLQNGNVRGFANPIVLEDYARKVYNSDAVGFIYYGFAHSQIDSAAIRALGKVAPNRPAQVAPIIALTSPKEGQVYRTLSIPLEATADQNVKRAWYVINSNSVNLTVLPHNITANEGDNVLELYAENNQGITSSVRVTFKVNTSVEILSIPTITIISPTNGGDYEASMPSNKTILNVSSDQKITSWNYSLNGAENKSFSNPSQIIVNNGENNLTVYGTNANGTGSASVSFNVLLVNPAYLPKITITSPAQGVTYTSTLIVIKSKANQTSIDSWKYSLNGGEKKDCNCGSEDYLEASEGRNNLVIYGKNANGTGQISAYFFVNTTSA